MLNKSNYICVLAEKEITFAKPWSHSQVSHIWVLAVRNKFAKPGLIQVIYIRV